MIRYLFLVAFIFNGYESVAEARKSYKAHVHGHATLGISVEKPTILAAELVVDSASIYGFEYAPVKPEDKKKQKEGLDKLKGSALELFKFDSSLGCKLTSATVTVIQESKPKKKVYGYSRRKAKLSSGEHSEVKASYSFSCKKPLKGTKLGFGFSKQFKGIQELKVIPLGKSDKTQIIENDVGAVEL